MTMDPAEQKLLRLRRRERIKELRALITISSSWLSIPLFAVFSMADYFYAHDKFLLFVCIRALIIPFCLLVNAGVKRTRKLYQVQAWGAFYAFVNAILITIMAALSGGKSSAYYAGLNLCAIAAGSFIPWTSGVLVFNLALIYLPFFALSLWTWSRHDNSLFITNAFFMAATVVITLVIRHFNEQYRMSAIRSRVALADELDRRGKIIQEKTEEALGLAQQFRQAQKMEAVGQLAGGIAHDFNNILMGIGLQAEFLMNTADTPKAKEGARMIVSATESAGQLTKKLLAFSRRQALATSTFDLNQVVAETIDFIRHLLPTSVAVNTTFSALPCWVHADRVQMQQVFMNLVINARDAMPDGGRLVLNISEIAIGDGDTGLHEGVPAGAYALMAVADTGHGISEEVLQKIFEPFFTTKPKERGTGLGLSIVYGIVSQSGGHIRVKSTPGAGTTFFVYIPSVAQPQAEAPRPHASMAALADASGSHAGTILVVDDEELVRNSIRLYLERTGLTILSCGDAREALKIASELKEQLVLLITDVVMPGMTGIELARALASQMPELPIIFMSGYAAGEKGHEEFHRAKFLQKPFTCAALMDTVYERLGICPGQRKPGN